jgi:Ca2+-binding RTX toxin-like protein
MQITTGNGDDTITIPALVNGMVDRTADIIRTNGGNDIINPGLGSVDYVYGGAGIDRLILDYSIGDTGLGVRFNGSSARGQGYFILNRDLRNSKPNPARRWA